MDHTKEKCQCVGRVCNRCKQLQCRGRYHASYTTICNDCNDKRDRERQGKIRAAFERDYEKRQVGTAMFRAGCIHAPGDFTLEEWRQLKARYNHQCLACGKTDSKLTVDHVIPLTKGGSNSIDNIQPLCKGCNSRKKDKDTDFRV